MNRAPFDAILFDGAAAALVTPARGDHRRGTSVAAGASWRGGISAGADGMPRHRHGTSVAAGASWRGGTSAGADGMPRHRHGTSVSVGAQRRHGTSDHP
jgi:hypothetical protein